ncbi:DUF1194 domain-containing protein [Ruegeria atlantica]|uniref:DUF1194 domain-containing protein n=1 Tax=Ruegeria atlantica TaxID=81569 RepID=UPI00147D66CB|nr:DUF1194 domain-containing protein [Ruegeria atlantica]
MMRLLATILSIVAGSVTAECRQALALGLDVSGSVDSSEYRLQLDGLAAALQRPEVVQLILSDTSNPVRLAIFEWSEPGHQRLLLNWTSLRSANDLKQIASLLNSTKRSAAPQGTAVGPAMLFGAKLLSQQSNCWKRTLDLSGDGKHNLGAHPREVKYTLQSSGLTINGLVIGADDPSHGDKRYVQAGELSAYYKAWVILGPDAFVEVALGFEAYEDAMTRKLIRELQGLNLSQAIQ